MAIGSSTSGVQAVTQQGWQQLKLQQARQNAEQAEQIARALSAQAGDAQRAADQAQETARSITTQSNQAQTEAGRARQGLSAISTGEQMQTRLSGTVDQVIEKQQAAPASTASTSATAATTAITPTKAITPPPVVNTQGQVTGTVINTTA